METRDIGIEKELKLETTTNQSSLKMMYFSLLNPLVLFLNFFRLFKIFVTFPIFFLCPSHLGKASKGEGL